MKPEPILTPEALPIIAEMDQITRISEQRHEYMREGSPSMADLLTREEKCRFHELKLMLRPKSREEAKADLAKRREARRRQPSHTIL